MHAPGAAPWAGDPGVWKTTTACAGSAQAYLSRSLLQGRPGAPVSDTVVSMFPSSPGNALRGLGHGTAASASKLEVLAQAKHTTALCLWYASHRQGQS